MVGRSRELCPCSHALCIHSCGVRLFAAFSHPHCLSPVKVVPHPLAFGLPPVLPCIPSWPSCTRPAGAPSDLLVHFSHLLSLDWLCHGCIHVDDPLLAFERPPWPVLLLPLVPMARCWLTVISHENRTITRFSLTMLRRNLGSWSPWVPLHGMCAPRVPAERF